MIENLIAWFYNYVDYYAIDIFLFLLVGYVFIRCRSIGYVYSGGLILFLIFLTHIGGYAMPQVDIAIVIFLGTLAGGWRYLARARSYGGGFGSPLFSLRLPQFSFFGSWLNAYDTRKAQSRFNKTYAEELAREKAKKDARGSESSNQRSTNRENRSNSEDSRRKKRKESFRDSRSEAEDKQSNQSNYQPGKMTRKQAMELLGLPEVFSRDKLKEQRDRLNKVYHSDSSNKSDNTMFYKVQEAYEILKK